MAVASGQPGPAILRDAAAALFPVVYIGLPLGAIAAVRVIGGREAVLLLMLTIVVSDSAQYYTGRAFGRRPLAPTISPKKTREGAIGGLIFGTAAMVAGGFRIFPAAPLAILVMFAAAVVVGGHRRRPVRVAAQAERRCERLVCPHSRPWWRPGSDRQLALRRADLLRVRSVLPGVRRAGVNE